MAALTKNAPDSLEQLAEILERCDVLAASDLLGKCIGLVFAFPIGNL